VCCSSNRGLSPPSMTTLGPHATEVYNRFKPGRALKHRTDQTSHDSTDLFHHDAVRRPRLSNTVPPPPPDFPSARATTHHRECFRASGSQRARRGPSRSSGRSRGHPLHVSPNADLWAVGDPINRLAAELRTACVVSGLCESPPTSDIHYYFFLDHFLFRLLNLGRG
jgi:hypothetical protein